ncbi:hypothetical protein TNCV_168931 [Trichonephila clavipes]|nr:hypothetical protein TNCV_168931 [Trichonephila clavipes]
MPYADEKRHFQEELGTVIEDEYDTDVDSEKELSLEQKLELAISKKNSTDKNAVQKSVLSKTTPDEKSNYLKMRDLEKILGKRVNRLLLTILPTSVDVERAFSTAGNLCT